MIITAPAKINLFLQITGQREDGYHLLESIFAFTEFGDEITIEDADVFSVTMTGPYAASLSHEPIEKNLIYCAAQLLKKTYGVKKNVMIHVSKNIPIGAGLGGGSSDAASVLKALNAQWRLNLNDKILAEIGCTLGADVPACIYQKTAFVSGVGEKIKLIDISLPKFVLLVNPNQVLSTQTVFQQYQEIKKSYTPALPFDIQNINDLKKTKNDLTDAAIFLMPGIKNILDCLSMQPGCVLARMSGSGPTCFALFDDEDAVRRAEACVRNQLKGYWIKRSLYLK